MSPSKEERSKEGRLKFLVDLEKWKNPDFPCSTITPNSLNNDEIMLQLQKRKVFDFLEDFFYKIKRISSIKDGKEKKKL